MNPVEHKLLLQFQFYSFAAFLFCSTFSIALSQITFGISLAIYLVRIALLRCLPTPIPFKNIFLWIGMYIIWMIVASLAGDTPLRSLSIMKEEWLFAIIPVGLTVMSVEADRRKLLTLLAISVGLMAIYAIVQSQTGWHLLKPGEPRIAVEDGLRISGNFSNPITFANYFGVAAAFIFGAAITSGNWLSGKIRLLLFGSSALATIAILLTHSRITILAIPIALIVAALLMGRRYYIPLGLTIIVAISSIFFIPDFSERFKGAYERERSAENEAGRIFIWTRTLKIIGENPVMGVGQGNFAPEYKALLREDINPKRHLTHAHNDLLNVAAICGLPGALFFALFIIGVFGRLVKGLKYENQPENLSFVIAAILATTYFVAASLTEATFADEEVRQFLMFVWAAGLAVLYNEQPATGETSG